jgi:type IV pilus assembly protein PilM
VSSLGALRKRLSEWSPLRRGRSTAIGLDIGSEALHLVQLDRAGPGFELRALQAISHGGDPEALMSSPSELRSGVRAALKRGGFRGRCVVGSPPADDVRLMVINYSLREGESPARKLVELAAERMREPLRDHIIDFVPIRTSEEDRGEHSALVAIVREEPVVRHLERLTSAGLEVLALEIPPVAIRRLVVRTSLERISDVVLVVHIGARTTDLTLLSGRRLLLYRQVAMGADAVIAAVSKALECDERSARDLLEGFGVAVGDEREMPTLLRDLLRVELRAVIEQTHKAISYAAFQTRGTALDLVYLLEGPLDCPGLDQLFGELLRSRVERLRPLENVGASRESAERARQHHLGLAIGYALRGLADV